MHEIPPRRLRASLQFARSMLVVLLLALIVVGELTRGVTGIVLIGLGAVTLLGAVVFPVLREVEFGFPIGVTVTAALHDRERELTTEFLSQRGDLGLYSQLMCDDPAFATRLLESAWARTTAVWRGPVTPGLRTYVLGEFIQLLTTHSRWKRFASPAAGTSSPVAQTALSALPVAVRIVVVLGEFADLPLAQIASLTARPLAEVVSDLRRAYALLAEPGKEG